MYLDLISDMALLTCSFIVVKSNVGMLNSPGQSIIFPPVVRLVLLVSFYCGMMLLTALILVALLSFGFSL